MTNEKYFTTGETAKILCISRSTVSRKFDECIFYGKKNPITGEREISQRSIEEFAQKYSIELPFADSRKTLVNLVTSDSQLRSIFQGFISNIEAVDFKEYANGCDFIISCTKSTPDIVIIDCSLPDISEIELIKAIQRSLTNKKMSIIGCFDSDDEANEVKLLIDDVLIKKRLNESVIRELILPKLKPEHISELQNENFTHKRMWRRIFVDLSAILSESPKVDNASGLKSINGINATIKNISIGGVYISHIDSPQYLIRQGNANMLLSVDSYPLSNWEALSKIVRFQSNDNLGVGLKFINLTEQNEKRLLHSLTTAE